MQPGQIVRRSVSRTVKSARQCSQCAACAARGAPQAEHRMTAASCGRNRGTSMIAPQSQWKRLPAASARASYCRVHLEQATRHFMASLFGAGLMVDKDSLARAIGTPKRSRPPRGESRGAAAQFRGRPIARFPSEAAGGAHPPTPEGNPTRTRRRLLAWATGDIATGVPGQTESVRPPCFPCRRALWHAYNLGDLAGMPRWRGMPGWPPFAAPAAASAPGNRGLAQLGATSAIPRRSRTNASSSARSRSRS